MVLICGLLPKPFLFLCFVSVSLTRAFFVGCGVFFRFLNNKDTLAIWVGGERGRSREGMIYLVLLLSLSCSIP